MISEFTLEAVKDAVETRFLDSLQVKGKQKPVKVYELLGRKDNGLSEDMIKVKELYDKGIENYLAREWDKGAEYFTKALTVIPDDGPSNVNVERCRTYKKNPPPDEWNGVYVMVTK